MRDHAMRGTRRRSAPAAGAARLLLWSVLVGCAQLPPAIRAPLSEPVAGPAVRPDGDPHASEAARFAELADAYRRMNGCGPTAWHPAAADIAQAHSADMARRDFFDHVNPDGLTPFERLRAARVGFRAAAENLAFGQATARQVLRSWAHSPDHRRNLEDCRFTHHGVGFDGRYWTHILLTP